MQSLVFTRLGNVEERQSPDPASPVWIRVEASGICGTDIKTVYNGHRFFKPPTVLGHEFYGQIFKAPAGYALPIGTWVVAAPYYECGRCDMCMAGNGDLCKRKKYVEGGAFAEYVGVPLDYDEGLFALPPESDASRYDVYSLTEPLACVLNGIRRIGAIPGHSRALIVGGGPMGALFALSYLQQGIEVAVVEPSADRAAALERLGIRTVRKEEVKKGEYDGIVIAVNIASLVSEYLPLVREGGCLLVFSGMPKGEMLSIDAGVIHYNEVSLKGCSGFALADFRKSFEMIKEGPDGYRRLITHRMGFRDGQKAFDMLKRGKAFKILLGKDF
ncbi:MAG: alcohol dehydrogenase catalytic domain-containing protein [Sphaerochaetaceae bacterium]